MTTDAHEHNPLIDAAREWYDAGYCVVPTHEDGGKRPYGGWREMQATRPEWAYTESLLSGGRFTGIGVILGAVSGNAEALEIEGPLDQAIGRLHRVIDKAAEYDEIGMKDLLIRVSQGCVEQSAGGGLHIFIRVTDGPALGNTRLAMVGQGKDRKVVSETRGEGGFMVTAPTPGRNGHADGTSYAFLNDGHPSKTVEVTSEERDLLHLLFTLALNEDDEREVAALTAPIARSIPDVAYEGVSAFDDFRQRLTWREILEPAGWTWSHRDAERDYWVRPGKRVADGHSASTIEDGPLVNFSTSVDWPTEQGLSKGAVYALLHHDGDLSAAAKSLVSLGFGEQPESRDLPPWEAALDPDATEEEKEEAKADWVSENLPRLDWRTEWARDHTMHWLVEPLIAEGKLIAVYSAPKVGKSIALLEIAAALASGRAVMGSPERPPIPVLYVDLENTVSDIVSRLEDMGYGPDDLDNLHYLSFPVMATLDSEIGGKQLLVAALHYGAKAVVVDTVSRLITGEENDAATWLRWYRMTGMKLKAHGITVIRLDHSGKDESKGQRGSSAKSGDVDAVWRMSKRGDDIIDFECEASRFEQHDPRFSVQRINDGVLRHRVIGNPWREKRDAVIDKMRKAGVPKDASLSTRAVAALIREAGMSVSSGEVRKDFIEHWASMPQTWDDLTLGEGE